MPAGLAPTIFLESGGRVLGREQRRLAAIVAADVVGYSRLMGRDESGTLARLRAHRTDLIDPAIAAHGGRIVKTMGDGLLLEFSSAVDATRCAIEIQTAMAVRNADVPESERIVFRIGANLGDIIIDGDDIHGDGVNVAARLQAEASAGGIVLAGAVHDAVSGRVKATFEDLGELSLKNIERPVRAYRARVEGAAAPASAAVPTPPVVSLALPDKPSIAVLPFTSFSSDVEQGYFADGLTDDVITELSRFRSLFVIASATTFTYRGKVVDVRDVARELGVRYLVQGSCRIATGRLRVTVQLIDPGVGRQLWSERYDRVVEDVFAIQEEMTRVIVATIGMEIETLEAEAIRRRQAKQPRAWQLAMRGLFEINDAYRRGDATMTSQAIETCQEALKIEPDLAIGWAGLAYAHWTQVFYRSVISPRDALNAGMEAARRAIEFDRREHRGFLVRGLLHLALGEHDHALGDLRYAFELNPNDPGVLQSLGFAELMSGDANAAKQHVLEAMRLNPKDVMRFNAYSILCNVCFALEEYEKGIEWGLLSKRERPDFAPTHQSMMKCYVGLGDIAKARVEADALRRVAPEMATATSNFRLPEHRERDIRFRRIALGLAEA
ncbi:MAG: hypothetical protein KIT36_01325 [Alphaproteobacteria bacterium]|nr:hypothetical protein [Alphaproteobacteria bacterium]